MKNLSGLNKYVAIAVIFLAIGFGLANLDGIQTWRNCRESGDLNDTDRLSNGCAVTLYQVNRYFPKPLNIVMASAHPVVLNALPAWVSATSEQTGISREFVVQFVDKSKTPNTGDYWNDEYFDIVPVSNEQVLEEFLTVLTYNSLLDKNPHWINRAALMNEARARARAWIAAINGVDWYDYAQKNKGNYVDSGIYHKMVEMAKSLPIPIALRR